MNTKSIITVILLIFVAVSLTVVVMRSTSTPGAEIDKASTLETSKDAAIVYYFHRTQRCPTCLRIEELTREVVRSQFAREIGDGTLELRIINIETPGSEHFETDFDLVAQSIVIANIKDGKQVNWSNLDKIWELIGTEPEFNTYVADAIRGALGQS